MGITGSLIAQRDGTPLLAARSGHQTSQVRLVPGMTEEEATITIDDTVYKLSDLSEEAIAQIQSIQFVDAELLRLQNLTALMATAKAGYQVELKKHLPCLPEGEKVN